VSAPIVEAIDATVRYGAIEALRALSVAVRPGERIAIVGRNAAGKSTLLRVLGGLVRPESGIVRLGGRPIADWSSVARATRIAFVAQRPEVAVAFTLREVVELGRFALPADPRRIDAAIADVGLSDCTDRPFRQLSVGQQQRGALARALAQAEPDSMLLLDEPFAAMDYGEVVRSLAILDCHAAGGGSVVCVLHDLALASRFASRVWLLDAGRLVDEGPPDAVLAPTKLAARFGVPFTALADGTPVPAWPRCGG
jgi:iron complex transport system ATP-binding protein